MSDAGIERVDPATLEPSEAHVRSGHEEPGPRFVESVASVGLITTPIGRVESGEIRLIDGVRRARAAEKAGLETVPVLVRDLDDAEARSQSFVLNDRTAGVRKGVADTDRDRALDRLADLREGSRGSVEVEIGIVSDADLIERELEQVPGVGRRTAERIAGHYTYEELTQAPEGYEDGLWAPETPLTRIAGVGEQTARAIRQELYRGETA